MKWRSTSGVGAVKTLFVAGNRREPMEFIFALPQELLGNYSDSVTEQFERDTAERSRVYFYRSATRIRTGADKVVL